VFEQFPDHLLTQPPASTCDDDFCSHMGESKPVRAKKRR
jgi:hypothetical protein